MNMSSLNKIYKQNNKQNVEDLCNGFKNLNMEKKERPSLSRNNEPREKKLERALTRAQEKVKTMKKELQYRRSNRRIYTQMMTSLTTSTHIERLRTILYDDHVSATITDEENKRFYYLPTYFKSDILFLLQEEEPGFGARIEVQMFDDLKANLRNIASAPNMLNDHAKDINENLGRVCTFLETIVPTISSNLKYTLSNSVSSLETIKEDFIKVTLLVTLVSLLMSLTHYRTAIALVLLFIMRFYKLDEQIIEMAKKLCQQLQSNSIFPQMDTENILRHDYFEICGKLLFCIISFILIKKMPGKQDIDNFLLRLDRVPKSIVGASKIFDYCTVAFEATRKQIFSMVCGKDYDNVEYTIPQIKRWAEEVRDCMKLGNRILEAKEQQEFAATCERLYTEGVRYQGMRDLDRETQRLVSATLVPAKDLYQHAAKTIIKGGGPRMRPICLWLVGESGIGKTEAVYPLCIDLLRTMGILKNKKDFHHQVYPRQVETEYWDGYKSQKIVIYDDAFQKRDDKTAANPELFEVIRACNTFPQHLHMAAIDDKNTFNSAEVLIYTTNNMQVDIQSLTFPDAFTGRMNDHAYVVRPKREYAKVMLDAGQNEHYKLDKSKLNKNVAIDLSIYEFQKMENVAAIGDAAKWGEVGRPLDYFAFADSICEAWQTEKEKSIRKLEFLERYAEEGRAFVQMFEENEQFYDAQEEIDVSSDIATRIAQGQSMDKIEHEYSYMNDKLYEAFLQFRSSVANQASKWDKYRNHIEACLLKCSDNLQTLKQKVLEIIQQHPILTCISILGTILSMVSLYKLFFSTDKSISSEMASSGENNTTKMSKKFVEISSGNNVIVELASSGSVNVTKPQRMQVEIAASGDLNTQRLARKTVESMSSASCAKIENDMALQQQAVTQGCDDSTAHMLVTDVLQKNTYRLSYERDNKRFPLGNATFLRGWVCIMPKHFLEGMYARRLAPNSTIDFSKNNQANIMRIPVSHFIVGHENGYNLSTNVVQLKYTDGSLRDCVLVNLHREMCHPHRNILHHFVKKEDQGLLTGKFCGTFATYHESNGEIYRAYQWLQNIHAMDKEITIYYPEDQYDYTEKKYSQRDCYSYNAPTQVGDCGSVVGLYNQRMIRKLIGMHIAGSNSNFGFACPLTQEVLNEGIQQLISKDVCNISAQFYFEPPKQVDVLKEPNVPEGNFVPIGKSNIRVGQAVKSTLLPSRIHGLLSKPIMKPALLRPTMLDGKIVNPLLNGLKKCGVETATIPKNIIKDAAFDVFAKINTQYDFMLERKKYQRILSYEEAIRGTLDDDFMRSINRTTSAGFPYTFQSEGLPGKTKWMGNGTNFDFTSPAAMQLRKDVFQLIENCRNGIISDVVFVDTLKDEKRDIAKVDIGKTRVFSAGPQHFIVAFRMYFLPFSAWLMHNRIDNEICVGTNPYSIDWERIAKKLNQKGPRVVAGDFGNFDGSLVASILWAIYWDIFVPWLEQFEGQDLNDIKLVTLGLWAHLVHSVHIFDNNVYMWTHSQPSGNPFTVIINCLYNSIIMRVVWILIMDEKKPQWRSMKHFRQNVSMVSYGDDNVLNISLEALKLYNQITIGDMMKKIKHEYTDEEKTGKLVESKELSETYFLKRKFRFCPELNRTVAPLKKEVIYEMLNWTRNTTDPDEILMANIDVAFREIVFHGEDAYNQLKRDILRVASKLPETPQILTYQSLLMDVENVSEAIYQF